MTTNPIQTLRAALLDLMAAEGGEPGDSRAQRRAWSTARAALRDTADMTTLREIGISLIKASNQADPQNRLIVAERTQDVDLSDGILRFASILAGTEWTDEGKITLGAGRKEG